MFKYIILVGFGILLIYASTGLPKRGDPEAPAHRTVSSVGSQVASSYYIQNAKKDAETPNIVTVVLADYRGYDTLGETTVIFVAGILCLLLLRREKND